MMYKCLLITVTALVLASCQSSGVQSKNVAVPTGPPTPATVDEVLGIWGTMKIHRVNGKLAVSYYFPDGELGKPNTAVTYANNILHIRGKSFTTYHWDPFEKKNIAVVGRNDYKLTFYPPDLLAGTQYGHHSYIPGYEPRPAGVDTYKVVFKRHDKLGVERKSREAYNRLGMKDPFVGHWYGEARLNSSNWTKWFKYAHADITITMIKGVYQVCGYPAKRNGNTLEWSVPWGKRPGAGDYKFTIESPGNLKGVYTPLKGKTRKGWLKKYKEWK